MIPPADFFADIDGLLRRSQPRRSRLRLWQAGILFLSMMMLGGLLGSSAGAAGDVVSLIVLLGLLGSLAFISRSALRRARLEAIDIRDLEELVQLRCWPQASAQLRGLLNQPMQLPSHRNAALVLLNAVLLRYNLFEPALRVQQTLLDDKQLDGFTEQTLRLARAATLLREDRLFDADRAIVEMRRQVARLGDNVELEAPAALLSAGLTLIELYRDVKTGHPAEALEMFTARRPLLTAQLGHRAGEAFLLAAKASWMLNQRDRAADFYRDATMLTPAVELLRRYPEAADLAQQLSPAPAPREAA